MDEKLNISKRKVNKSNFSTENMPGKIPPQALNLEEAVLGALMLDKDAVALIIDILRPDSFYKDPHKHVYKAVCNLFEKNHPVDLLTVAEELKLMGKLEMVGGPYQLVELTNRVASSANIEHHARIIAQKHIQRELIRISTETIKSAFDDTIDVFNLLDKAEQNLFDITDQNISKGTLGMSTLMTMAIKQLEEVSQKEDGLTGVPSGFINLDKITSGWQPSDLIIVAARPGMGKTSFTMALARNASIDFNKPVAFFSLEMPSIQLINRLISMETEIPSERLRKGKLEEYEWQQLHSSVEQLNDVPLFIDDTPGISIFELRAKCRRLKMQHDIQMVIIDYLQLMSGSGDAKGNREQEISMISRGLKALAKELNVPVIALSQLSRAVEVRGGSKKPQLSDLRESGAIEQDADIVSFIYRPEYYQIYEDENGNSLKDIGEIIIAKHRNGPLDTIRLKWNGQFAKFSNLEDEAFSGMDDSSYFDQLNSQLGETFSSKLNSENSGDFNDIQF